MKTLKFKAFNGGDAFIIAEKIIGFIEAKPGKVFIDTGSTLDGDEIGWYVSNTIEEVIAIIEGEDCCEKVDKSEIIDDSKVDLKSGKKFGLDGGDYTLDVGLCSLEPMRFLAKHITDRTRFTDCGLLYPSLASVSIAAKDITRYCRMRRLAEMVNGEGVKDSLIYNNPDGYWQYSYTGIPRIHEIFTKEGAKKACELLNSGRFSLDG